MGSEILIKIFIIFSLLSLDRSHIVISNALSNDDAAGDYYLSLYHHMEESGNGNGKNQNQVHRVSGEDEHDQKQAVLLKKFRALLGLRRFKAKSPLTYDSHHVSPSPSPSPSIEAETTVPAPPPSPPRFLHAHHHHWPPRSSPARPHHNTDKRVKRRMLVTILVSVGAAAFLACAIGFIFFCFRFKKNRKSMWVFRKRGRARGKSKYVNSSKSTRSKVNSSNNSGMDLFYLNSLGIDLEQQSSCIKQMNESVNTSSVNNNNNNNNNNTLRYVLNEREDENEEVTKSKSDNGSSSSTREIMPVHHEDDDAGSVKYESDDGGEKIEAVPVECRSSDDESFHSFGDSCSSNDRLSNASVGSNLSDKPENFSPIEANTSPSIETLNSQKETHSSPPPPPPPPPPPVPPPVRPPRSASCSVQFVNKASSSPALPDSSSPANSESSSQSSKPQESPPSIPPPPCPPPPRSNNAVKGPPPPPSLFAPSTPPLGKDGAPLPKLKPLHWDKVRAAPDRTMVWDKIRSNSFELDEEMIESLFGYNIQNSMKNDESKSKTPSPSKHVLEPKRLQNITILSKALNVTTEQVCDSLIKGEGLSLQQLEALVKMVPTKEEESKLFSYKGDINELGSAEKFVRGILSIPFAFQRVEAMLYRETFEDEVIHLRNSFSMLEEACKELRSSRLFLKLLEAVLKTGNRMNIGTIRGGARAFKLDALLKLADVKGTDGKTTLLHFVVLEIIRSEGIRVSDSIMGKINQRNTNKNRNNNKTDEEREEGYRRLGLELVSGLSSELYNVKKTATIDLDVLASSVSNLSQGLSGIQQLLNDDDDSSMGDEKNGNFEKSMKLFVNYAKKKLKEVQEDERKVLLLVKEITEYFHGDVSKEEGNLLRIFVIVRDFLGMLDHVCKELRSLKVPTSPNPLAPFR